MTPSVTVGAPTSCPFCEKIGLPILPLRYAVARGDMGNAPKIAAPFDATADEGKYGGKAASLQLNGKDAHYTARLLRPGYLYVYDEQKAKGAHAKPWSAYIVTQGAFLYPFDPLVKAPPGGWSTPHFSCKRSVNDPGRTADRHIERCFTVEDADKATKVWLGFSDTLWTQDVLKKHDDAAYREKHMRSINIADVRSGATQAHVAGFDKLGTQVAEYAADGKALLDENRAYVRKLLPKPYVARNAGEFLTLYQQIQQDKVAKTVIPPLVQDLLAATVQTDPRFLGDEGSPVAAWAFSPSLFAPETTDTASFVKWGDTNAKPYKSAMVALDDPAGIAMELNGLVLQRIAEITAVPAYRWEYETATSIATLRQIVCQSALTKASSKREGNASANIYGGGPGGGGGGGVALAELLSPQLAKDNAAMIASAGQLSDADKRQVIQDSWGKDYASRFNEPALDSYLATVQTKLAAAAKPLVQGLDVAYVGWLDSKTLARCFMHNFDDKSLDSGAAYTTVARLVVNQASGRTKVAQFLTKHLGEDASQPYNWVARATLFNHSALIAHLQSSAADTQVSWNELADKTSGYLLATVAAGDAGKLEQPGNALAQWVHELSGPLVNTLNGALDQTVGVVGKAGNLLPARMQIGMLGWLAKVGSPDTVLVDLRGMWTRKQAVRALANALAEQAGGDPLLYRSDVRKAFDEAAKAAGTKTPFRGFLVLRRGDIEGLAGMSVAERSAVISGALSKVQPEQFDELLERGVGKLANLDVKAGVVGAIFAVFSVGASYRELALAKPGELGKDLWNLGSGTSSLIGGVLDTAGKAVKNIAGETPRLAQEMTSGTSRLADMAEWLGWGGKAFGVIGGVMAAAMLGYQAFKEGEAGETDLAVVHWTLAGATAIGTAIALFATGALALVGLALLVVVALVETAMALLKDNDTQNWLNKSHYFGDHKDIGWFSSKDDYAPYADPVAQRKGFLALVAAGA